MSTFHHPLANHSTQAKPVISVAQHKAQRDLVQAILLLLLSLAVFFWPAVFGGRVLLPADLIYDLDPLWQPLAPDGYTQPSNHLLSDQVYQFFPWRLFTLRSLAQSRLPLWNPYSYGGQPFIGNAQSAIFSPFNLFSYLLPVYASHVAVVILRLFVAGIFTFLFAREIGLGKPGALLAMMAFTFSGSMIVWVGYPLASAIAWLPAMLLTIERALARQSMPYVFASGLAVGAQFLGGHPETSLLVMLAWLAYALYRAIILEGRQPARLAAQLARIGTAAAIGSILAAVQLLPFIETLLQSAILVHRQSRAVTDAPSFLAKLLLDWQNWPTAITSLLPQYLGTPLHETYLYPYSNYVEQNAYVGVLPLALAISIVWHSIKHRPFSRRNIVLFFALLAFVSLGVALRLPLLNLVNFLPLLSISANGRLRLVYAFATCMLAGLELDRLRSGQPQDRRPALRILILLALASLFITVCTYAGFVVFKDEIIQHGRAFVESSWGTPHFSRPLEHYYALVEERYDKKLAEFLPSNIAMYLPTLVALATLAVHRWGWKRHANEMWIRAVLGLTVFDAFLTGMPFNPTIAPQDVFPTPGAVRFLQQDADIYRVCSTGTILNPNSSMLFGISDVRGYDAVAPLRYADLVERMEGHSRIGHYLLFTGVRSPLLDLLNVKYVLTEQELEQPWELVYQDSGTVRIYRNPHVLPRAFVAYRAKVVEGADQSLESVIDSSFDFRQKVVLEESPADWTEPPQAPAAAADVRIVNYEPNQVSIQVETAAKGLLVLTDTYMPGWKALVDGHITQVYIADHAFRAVVVPAGTHQVDFSYKPSSFRIGAAISLLAASASTLALLVSWLRRAKDSTR